jgi:hypothetical protein
MKTALDFAAAVAYEQWYRTISLDFILFPASTSAVLTQIASIQNPVLAATRLIYNPQHCVRIFPADKYRSQN